MVCIISRLAGSSWDEFLDASHDAYKTMQISVDSNNELKIVVPGWEKAQEIYNKMFRFALPFSVAMGALGMTCSVVTCKALFSRSYGQAYLAHIATLVQAFFCWQGVKLIQLVNKRIRRYEEMPNQIAQFKTDLLQQGISNVNKLHKKLPCQWKHNVSFNVLSEKELLTLIQQEEDPSHILPYFCWIPEEMGIKAPFGRIHKAVNDCNSQAGIMLAEKLIQQSKIALEVNHGTTFWTTLNKIQWTPITDELHSKALNIMSHKQLDLLCSNPSQVSDVKTMISQYCEEAKRLYFAQLFKTALDSTSIDNHDEHIASVRQALGGTPHFDKKLLLEAFELAQK